MPCDTAAPVPVAMFRPASVDDIKSAILEDNSETNLTEYYSYSLGVTIFKTNQLRYNFPMSIFEGFSKFVGVQILLMGRILEIRDAVAVVNNQSQMKKLSWAKWEKIYLPLVFQIMISRYRQNYTLQPNWNHRQHTRVVNLLGV